LIKKIRTLFIGNTIASLGITCLIKSGLGCFSVTASNIALANWLGVTIGVSGLIVEAVMLLFALKLKEGIGIGTLVNTVYGSLSIDFFNSILPSHPFMVLGLLAVPFGWGLMAKAGLSESASNILMNGLIKKTGKSISFIRTIQEAILLIVGFLGARNQVTFFTLILTLFLGKLIQIVYNIMGIDPSKIEHSFLIKGK
jgi:uncharacterized membrane protein YczE